MAGGVTALRRHRRLQLRIVLGLLAALALAILAWMWLRSSSLVAVERVRITGVSGPQAADVRGALGAAARNMTTLDVNTGELEAAVKPYPQVRSISVSTEFPHGLRIRVSERLAVAEIDVGGETIAVSRDGTLLGGSVEGYGTLPVIPVAVVPGGDRLTGAGALAAARLASAAPRAFLAEIQQISRNSAHELVAQLRGGPTVYFGSPDQAAAKWRAVIGTLDQSSSSGAAYLDVTDPQRPVAGGLSDASSASIADAAGPGSGAASAAGSAGAAAITTSTTTTAATAAP